MTVQRYWLEYKVIHLYRKNNSEKSIGRLAARIKNIVNVYYILEEWESMGKVFSSQKG